ncbi:MAG: hypothetical protein U0175_04525 [Caldilineaceae bacterium]
MAQLWMHSLCKVGPLQENEKNPLAGRMLAIPGYRHSPAYPGLAKKMHKRMTKAFRQSALPSAHRQPAPHFRFGFHQSHFLSANGEQGVLFITRAKSNLAFQGNRCCSKLLWCIDQMVGLDNDRQQVRLIQFITASGIVISPTTSMHRIFPLSMPWLLLATLAN